MRRHRLFALALVLQVAGAGLALLASSRHWQTITTAQPGRTDVLAATGRSIDPGPTALSVVALAGVVAVVATRGRWRQLVGAVLAATGVGLIWRSLVGAAAVDVAQARSLVAEAHRTVAVEVVVPAVSTHPVWAVLSGIGGLAVLLAGLLTAWRGHRWGAMSTRYDAPAARPAGEQEPAAHEVPGSESAEDAAQRQARASTALWNALDRGEDPTH